MATYTYWWFAGALHCPGRPDIPIGTFTTGWGASWGTAWGG